RLNDLQRQLPTGYWEPEDWFRPRSLNWADGSPEERLVPGAERDCEVGRQISNWASVNGAGLELGRTLLAGRWRATIDVECEGFVARRLIRCFEWQPPTQLTPGATFNWLRECPPEEG